MFLRVLSRLITLCVSLRFFVVDYFVFFRFSRFFSVNFVV